MISRDETAEMLFVFGGGLLIVATLILAVALGAFIAGYSAIAARAMLAFMVCCAIALAICGAGEHMRRSGR